METQQSLAGKAYDAIKADIVACRLRPGQLVLEAELASRYEMSKTPIREALNLLGREGLVQVLPRKGTLVAPISVPDIQQTYYLRMLLEPEGAALAARNATAAQLTRLTELTEASKAAAAGDDRTEALRINRRFHLAVAEAAGIPRLVTMLDDLLVEVERFYNSHVHGSDDDHRAGERHQELLDAIVGGDSEQARRVTAENIRASQRHLVESMIGGPESFGGLSLVDGGS